MKKLVILLLLAFFCGAGVAHPAPPPRSGYQVNLLRPLNELGNSSAFGLNSKGEAVGYSVSVLGYPQAVYWGLDRVPVALGTFGGRSAIAWGINDGSYVVGDAENSDGFPRAFIWDPISGVKHELGVLGGSGGQSSWAKAINLKGQVAGYASSPSDGSQYWACLFELGQPPAPIDQSAFCMANGINKTGMVAGTHQNNAVVWNQGVRQDLVSVGVASGVNDSGEVVGYYYASGHWRSFIWDKFKGVREIPSLGGSYSYANAINNHGQVVGRADTPDGKIHGFLWEEGKGVSDINLLVDIPRDLPPGSYFMGCSAINDRGEILSAINDGVIITACLLRPGMALPGVLDLLLGSNKKPD
jgi:probable HAF family extracellular repeat protein